MIAADVHRRGMEKSTTISGFLMANPIAPAEVISVLTSAGVNFMLVGFYGLVGWTKTARATEDVDVIVALRHVKKATGALLDAFPHLEAHDLGVVVRLRDRESGDIAIDVMKPNQQLFRVAFKNSQLIHSGGQSYRIPSLEMALAMKFAPMVSPHRQDEKKHLDAHDFIRMVRMNSDIDLEKLAELGDLVYPEGGKELLEQVRRVRAGEKLLL
jgi:hypothetical protein